MQITCNYDNVQYLAIWALVKIKDLGDHRWFSLFLVTISDHTFIGLVQGEIYRKTLNFMVKTMVSCRFSALSPSNFGLQQAANGAAAAVLRGGKQRRGAAVGRQRAIGAGFQ